MVPLFILANFGNWLTLLFVFLTTEVRVEKRNNMTDA